MQIVQTTLRPGRVAFAYSTRASNRVLRRTFRLAGGRWGGGLDLILCVDERTSLTPYQSRFLSLADPDFIAVVDPRLDGFEWDTELQRARIQPFELFRLRERAERTQWRFLFRERLTLPPGEDDPPRVYDLDGPGVSWRRAAVAGFPFSDANVTRVPSGEEDAVTPYRRSIQYLARLGGTDRWVVFGDENDAALAADFWSIRALGGRPIWRPPTALTLDGAPFGVVAPRTRVIVYAPRTHPDDVAAASARWSTSDVRVVAAPSDPALALPSDTEPAFVRQAVPVPVHRERLRLSTPGPRQLREPLPPVFAGVASHRIRSPEPGDPDGLLLARNWRSRQLVEDGSTRPRRVTAKGLAEYLNLASPQLVQIPLVSYSDAVAAPFEAVGFAVQPSDKGDYQQLALERAGGLLYLAWLLRQPQSERLLDLFFENPGGLPRAASFRRAVAFSELQQRVYHAITPPSGRLRAERRSAADDWLASWSRTLLDRELMIAGYLLDCPRCRARGWYQASIVGQRHECARCGAKTVLPAGVVRSYRLNEAFFMMRQQGGQVVTLALAALRNQANESFLYLAETEIVDASTREVDIAALIDGDLVLVEAKSNNSLSRAEMNKYRYLARRCNATRVIFATTSRPDAQCSGPSCAECLATHGEHHADRAWDPGARALIQEARANLATSGIAVEAWCHHHLIAQHDTSPLEEFVRRPAPQGRPLPT